MVRKADAGEPAPSTPESALPALARLASELGLSDAERQVLCALAVRDLDGEFVDLLNTLDRGSTLTGPMLAARWTGLPEPEVRRTLASRRALVGLGLVSEGYRERSATSHSVEDRLLTLLESEETSLQGYLATRVRASPAAKLTLDDYPHLASLLPDWLAYLDAALSLRLEGVNVLIHGSPGTGKTELSRALAERLGADLLAVHTEDDEGDALPNCRMLSAVRLAQRALGTRERTLLLVDEADDLLPTTYGSMGWFGFGRMDSRDKDKSWLVETLETNVLPTLWVANDLVGVDPALLRRFDLVLHLDEPPARVKQGMLERAFAGKDVDPALIRRLAELPRLQPGHVEGLARLARQMPEGRRLEPLIERQTRELRSLLYLPPIPRAMPRPLGDFRVDWLNPDRPIEPLLERAIRAGEGRFCLYGPPGTGKSAFAGELARRLERPLQVCQGADLLSCYVGETEKAIVAAFERAESAGAVLLIDEVEGFLSKRESLRHSWEISAVNALLTSLDAFGGFVVLTTNLFERLDPAVLRRLEHKLELRPPTAEQRRSLWARFREHFGWSQGADLEAQLDALEGLTPGDFHQVARQYLGDPTQATPFGVLQALRAELALKSKVAA